MNNYIKKPVKIQAMKWNGINFFQINEFVNNEAAHLDDEDDLIIHTLEGDHKADVGDMIIKGIKGEFYPCKPDIFEKTYFTEEEYAAQL